MECMKYSTFFSHIKLSRVLRRGLFFLSTFALLQNSCYANTAAPKAHAPANGSVVSADDKALQSQVLSLTANFSLLIHKIAVRIGSLHLTPEQLTAVKGELEEIQDNLKALKARYSLHVDRTQLLRLLSLLNATIKSVEGSLKTSFQKSPEIDPADFKRSPEELTPAEVDNLLKTNEKRLRGFDVLIANMSKTSTNKMYSWIANRWNTPLFSITGLGGNANDKTGLDDSNKEIYISSILKRIAVYTTGAALVVYNIPEEYLEYISYERVRNSLVWLKRILGTAPYAQESRETKKGHDVVLVKPDGNNYLGGIEGALLQSDERGYPKASALLPGAESPVPAPVDWKGNGYTFTENYPNGTQFFLHYAGQNQTREACSEQTLSEIFYNGPAYALTNNALVARVAPDVLINKKTGGQVFLPDDELAKATLVPQARLENASPFHVCHGTTGKRDPFPQELVINKNEAHPPYATEYGFTRKNNQLSHGGFINWIAGNFGWLVHPNFSIPSFELAVGAYVASEIYKDFQTLRKDLPQICAYLHNKLRGEEEEFRSSYLVPTETFDDVVGRQALKNQLMPIINFVANPTSYIQAGIKIPRGYLLAGEPQTGKTLMVRALGGQLSKVIKEKHGTSKDVKVFPIEVHYLIHNGIKFYMDILKDYAPCILFCDEFDLTGAQRTENKTFLAEALTALSGYTTSSDLQELVLFVIATNRPENIDYAIRADGRCGTTLYFENPYFQDRKNYFEHFFKTRLIDASAFNLDAIAQETEACSYGTLQAIANGILSTADKYNELPSQRHVEEVLDTVVRKMIYETSEMPENIRHILAARYGAKAFASVVLNPDKKFVAASIMKITEKIEEKPVLHHYNAVNDATEVRGIRFGRIFTYNRSDTYGLISNEERLKECKIALAGTVGQRVLGLSYTSYPEDEIEALKIARRITFEGCPEQLFPRSVREQKSMEAYTLVEQCRREMEDLLERYKPEYEKLVDLLQRRKIIRPSDIKECFGLVSLDFVEDYFSPLSNTDFEKIRSERGNVFDASQDDAIAWEEEEEEALNRSPAV